MKKDGLLNDHDRRMTIRTFLAGVFLMLIPCAAVAASNEMDACDITIYRQMNQQAWLEGQREMEVAQRLILKPDSTLEYTCFKQEADGWGKSGGNAWNFTDHGGGAGSPNMASAINGLVQGALTAYLLNYGHLFLGGTYKDAGGEFLTELEQPDSICNPQYWIWTLAKCVNAPGQKDAEGHLGYFFPLAKLAAHDVRDMPLSCADPYKKDRDDLVTEIQEKQEAFPDVTQNPPYGVDNASKTTGTPGGQLYTDLLENCGTPVKTGFKVKPLPGGGSVTEDAVCIAPGCAFVGGSCN